MTALTLRRALPADAAALAGIHHQVWQETYAALAPPQAVAALDGAHRLAQWTGLLAQDDPVTLIALAGDTPAGLVCHGRPGAPVFGPLAEIRHLYLLAAHRGRGHGLRLLTAALMDLRGQGYPGAALAVVEGNARARAFYAAAGGTEVASFTDKGPLWPSRNRLVEWRFAPG
ncbi:MAG: GNAT family N-acetyltransferase [Paracoccaceae bacterium]